MVNWGLASKSMKCLYEYFSMFIKFIGITEKLWNWIFLLVCIMDIQITPVLLQYIDLI